MTITHWLIIGWAAVLAIVAGVIVWLELQIRQLERGEDKL